MCVCACVCVCVCVCVYCKTEIPKVSLGFIWLPELFEHDLNVTL